MKILGLGDNTYEESGSANYGDCFLIDNGKQLVIYDCGSTEHAEVVLKYMEKNKYDKVILVLSHNDADHFEGVNYLLNKGKISKIRTVLLFKHLDAIEKELDDGRRNKRSIRNQIAELYDNIASLSGENLEDIYDKQGNLLNNEVISGVKTVGPSFSYLIQAVAKHLNNQEGDTIDGETIYNATSVQLEVKIGTHKVLLCGDSNFQAIEKKLKDYDVIQLPHHGKKDQAEQIFAAKAEEPQTVYVVSDNTGKTNGGSDHLDERWAKGHHIRNTRKEGTITISEIALNNSRAGNGHTLGVRYEIFSTKRI